MKLTPNQLSMLLSIHIREDCDHSLVSREALQYKECQAFLVAHGLATATQQPGGPGEVASEQWVTTDKGATHLDGVLGVHLPVSQWRTVYPKSER